MSRITQALAWLDRNVLFILSAFLIIFIPLFPKIPLFEILPGYIVRARAEDLLIFITAIVWMRDAYKKRFPVATTYLWVVIAYTFTGIMAIFLGTLLLQSIPAQLLHISKSSLHLFRYLEYFALFFFLYSSVKTKNHVRVILGLLVASVAFIVFYGFGQTYLNFPLYSTMNREYSKGTTLYLQEGARPQSTFAGHYDLAAYLVIVLPILFSLALWILKIPSISQLQNNPQKFFTGKNTYIGILLHIIHLLGAWMLVISGSKTALFAYFIGIIIVMLQYARKISGIKQQLKWSSIGLITLSIGLIIFLNFFAQESRDKLISLLRTNSLTNSVISRVLPSTENTTSAQQIPDDLSGDGHEFTQITVTLEDGTKEQRWIQQKSDWSANALKYGISMGIRLDTLWPNALLGFFNMPLFGNGYATLAAINNTGEFTYAESTDNNFLRTLGETGILGFITFYGFILIILLEIRSSKKRTDPLIWAVSLGYIAATVGLLLNATYIDVFASSKVAYTFWALSGMVVAINAPKPTKSIKKIAKFVFRNKSLLFSVLLLFFILHRNPFHKQSLVTDLNMTDTQIETLVTTQCYLKTGSFTVCRDSGLVLKDNFNLYSLLLVPFMKIYNSPVQYYLLNISIFLAVIVGFNVLTPLLISNTLKTKPREIIIFSSSVVFVLLLAFFKLNTRPLTSIDLLLVSIVLPAILFATTFFLHKLKFKIAYFVQITVVLGAALLLVNQNIEQQLLLEYRNNTHPPKNFSVEMANIHFDTQKYLNRPHDFYLISDINPYYYDFFGNGNYKILPLTKNSKYTADAAQVYEGVTQIPENLLQLYEEKLATNSVYISNYATNTNTDLLENFTATKDYFDLKYVTVGCEDTCNLYQVFPETPKVSSSPKSINATPFSLENLNNSYSFSVVPNQYQPLRLQGTLPYTAQAFSYFLNRNITTNFLIVSGDVYSSENSAQFAWFNANYEKTPLLYTKGNSKLDFNRPQPSQDQYFYTDTEFFLLMDVAQDSTITSAQQKFFYNALLELEKLPNIKTIFLISHDLDWENRSNQSNFIFTLEKKFAQFPNITKYVITHSHAQDIQNNRTYSQEEITQLMSTQTLKHVIDESKNTHYLTASVKNWPSDSFLNFTVLQDKSISIEYRQNTITAN